MDRSGAVSGAGRWVELVADADGGRRAAETLFWELVHLYQLGLTRFPTQKSPFGYNCVHEWHNYTGVVWYNCVRLFTAIRAHLRA